MTSAAPAPVESAQPTPPPSPANRAAGSAEALVRELFEMAGIRIGGPGPGDITVHDSRFYGRLLRDASVGRGRSRTWTAGGTPTRWTSLLEKIMRAGLREKVTGQLAPARADGQGVPVQPAVEGALRRIGRGPLRHRQRPLHEDARPAHGLHLRLLEERTTLAEAQEAKLDLVCRKLGLQPGHARARSRLRLGRLRRAGPPRSTAARWSA